ncbi:hypothetical protein D9615_005507 [Tricholomella constricta]|uniref:Major facilitator superfamily (MFS) profile domain-containing protein n=1 Tax=Tricholomella constricta TaxID=117010 RepID=A0A8H5M5L9_9AGAR|nr:hypothetical protein D9615_005507 [Tricholomella constricta]
MSDNAEYKEAFALFDKRGTGAVPRETLGDLLRALGQNPTQAEVGEIIAAAPRDVDYNTFLKILNRPDGFKPAGTPGKPTCLIWDIAQRIVTDSLLRVCILFLRAEEFIRGFQVFDKEGNGFIGAGELRYVLTQLGEKMTDEEVDELLKGVQIGAYSPLPITGRVFLARPDGNVNYESFVRTILSQIAASSPQTTIMSLSVSIASDKSGERDRDLEREADTSGHPTRSSLTSVILVLTCTFAMIVNNANNTAVSISLSIIGRDLDIEEIQLQWLVSAYPLSSGCLLLVFGRLADLHGRKKVFIFGSIVLAAFTLGCSFANDSMTLDILRGFQGIGAAATIPASLGILAHAFPPSRARAIAFSTFAAGAPVGAAFGMALGGVLTQETVKTWRSPFYLQTGLTLLCLIGGMISFDPDCPSTEVDKRIDWLGALLVTAGLVLVVFVLGQGEIAPDGWKTPYIIALLITGIFLIVLFIIWQSHLEKLQNQSQASRKAQFQSDSKGDSQATTPAMLPPPAASSWPSPPPLMRVSLWRRAKGRFAVMMCIAFLTWCSFMSWGFWAQLYYQNYIGYSPIRTVVRLLPMFIFGVMCNITVAVLVGCIPVLYLIGLAVWCLTVLGTFGTSLAGLLFALINPNAIYWAFGFPGAVFSVCGADFVFTAGTLFIAKVAEPHEQSLAGALFQTMTQLGTSLGVTVTTVIFNRVVAQKVVDADSVSSKPTLASYQAAQWGSFAFGVLATVLALVFFRGVGVVGHRKNDAYDASAKIEEERTAVSTHDREKQSAPS